MDTYKEYQKYARSEHNISSMSQHRYMQHYDVNNITPYILEERPMRVTQMDVFSRLMMDRIIFLGTGINDEVANIIVSQLLFLESVDKTRDITMYINSPGGSVYSGLSIHDTMGLISADVATVVTGMAASMGAVLLSSGKKGKRSGLRHSRVMIHQPSSGTQGVLSDMEIALKETIRIKNELYQVLVESTGQTFEQIELDCDRDKWLTTDEAIAYGLLDNRLGS